MKRLLTWKTTSSFWQTLFKVTKWYSIYEKHAIFPPDTKALQNIKSILHGRRTCCMMCWSFTEAYRGQSVWMTHSDMNLFCNLFENLDLPVWLHTPPLVTPTYPTYAVSHTQYQQLNLRQIQIWFVHWCFILTGGFYQGWPKH